MKKKYDDQHRAAVVGCEYDSKMKKEILQNNELKTHGRFSLRFLFNTNACSIMCDECVEWARMKMSFFLVKFHGNEMRIFQSPMPFCQCNSVWWFIFILIRSIVVCYGNLCIIVVAFGLYCIVLVQNAIVFIAVEKEIRAMYRIHYRSVFVCTFNPVPHKYTHHQSWVNAVLYGRVERCALHTLPCAKKNTLVCSMKQK